jgi:hypothetical protein
VNPSRALLIAALGLSVGCAPSLSTMQPAHVAPKGHVQATAGFEVSAPTGTISRVIDAGQALSDAAEMNGNLTPEEKQRVFEAGVNVVVVPPSFGYIFAANYTVLDNWEVGIRYAGGGWRLGTRYQILHHETGPLDLTIGAGVARAAYEIPLASYIPILAVDDFTRWTIDLTPAQIGTSRSWFRVWAAPKFLYSHFSTAMRLSIPAISTPDLATFSGNTFYYGGQGGFALGYRYIFFAFELTLAKISGKGTATAMVPSSGGNEMIAGDANLDGFVIYPTFGFIGEF